MAVETLAPRQHEDHAAGDRYLLTVHDYHRMAEAGILDRDARVELIEGEIVWMAPMGGPHFESVAFANRPFVLAVGDQAIVSVQMPVRLSQHSEPEPDIAIIRNRRYHGQLPTVDDVYLLVEVAVSSLDFDRGRKLSLYARSGVPEVWIVDVSGKVVLRHTDPSDDAYRTVDRHKHGDHLTLTQLPSASIGVGEFFPESE